MKVKKRKTEVRRMEIPDEVTYITEKSAWLFKEDI